MDTENNSVGVVTKNRRRKSKQVSNNAVTNNNVAKDGNKSSSKKIGQCQVDANCNNVAAKLQQTAPLKQSQEHRPKSNTIALDCEMVGVGPNGKRNMLARVSIVNEYGEVLMDKYVKPTERVIDYRTPFSGITAAHLKKAHNFANVRAEVRKIIFGKILVGHSLCRDFAVLKLNHPQRQIRDTANYEICRKFNNGHAPPLRLLAKCILNCDIQNGAHCSVEDAQATMAIYKVYAKDWEASLQPRDVGKQSQRAKKSGAKSSVNRSSQLPEIAEANKFWVNKADLASAERNLHILKNGGTKINSKDSKPKRTRTRRNNRKKKDPVVLFPSSDSTFLFDYDLSDAF